MSEDDSSNAMACKVVLIGESGVGKTSIMERFVNNKFSSVLMTTTGASFKAKLVDFPEDKSSIKFDIWDTAGQERFRSLAKVFYKNAAVCVLVYDITQKVTFEEIKKYWYNEIKENTKKGVVIAICGNKCDQYDLEDIPEKDVKAYAKSIGAIFSTTSAKTNEGIDDMFINIGKKILHPDSEDTSTLTKEQLRNRQNQERINQLNAGNTKKKKCCG